MNTVSFLLLLYSAGVLLPARSASHVACVHIGQTNLDFLFPSSSSCSCPHLLVLVPPIPCTFLYSHLLLNLPPRPLTVRTSHGSCVLSSTFLIQPSLCLHVFMPLSCRIDGVTPPPSPRPPTRRWLCPLFSPPFVQACLWIHTSCCVHVFRRSITIISCTRSMNH